MRLRFDWFVPAMLVLFAWTGFVPVHAAAPSPVIEKAAKGEQCVEPTEYMRRNHMEVLKGHRDKTVHEGIRTKKYSLKECINCHASQETGSVTAAKDNFCVSCHSYASVKIDCFDCHSSKPQSTATLHPLTAKGAHLKHQMAAQAGKQISVKDMAKLVGEIQ